jgi:hypothetical protein
MFFAALALLLAGTAFAQRGRWELLGDANVDGAADHDRIEVTKRDGAFRAIQIKVERAAIRFDRVVIHFHNGESMPVPIRALIPAGGQTRIIDLPGERRIIHNVEFFYERAGQGRGRVILFGLH